MVLDRKSLTSNLHLPLLFPSDDPGTSSYLRVCVSVTTRAKDRMQLTINLVTVAFAILFYFYMYDVSYFNVPSMCNSA